MNDEHERELYDHLFENYMSYSLKDLAEEVTEREMANMSEEEKKDLLRQKWEENDDP